MSDLLVKVGLNGAGFKTGLSLLKAQALGFRSSLGGIFSGIGGQILSGLGLSMGVAGLGMLTRSAIDAGSKISDLGTRLRIGTTELQALQAAARAAGLESTVMENSLRNLTQRSMEAADGNQGYQDAFKRLGIDLQSFLALPLEQKLQRVGQAYVASGGSMEAYKDVSDLLGTKTGPQLLEVLERLATEGMDALTQSAVASGQVMDEATIQALDRAADEIGRWQNRIIVAFGTFLADMGSAIGRQKWGFLIGQKFAEAGRFIEITLRDISNYVIGVFNTVFRYLNAKFSDFTGPIRNLFYDFIGSLGGALSKFVSLFNDAWAQAIDTALKGLDELQASTDRLTQADKKKGFSDIFGEEMQKAERMNTRRKDSDLWTTGAVDWWKERADQSERAQASEKEIAKTAERTRTAKIAEADAKIKVKAPASQSKKTDAGDSYLARIGGGGLTAARFDTPEKQLSEAKKQSELLAAIKENTATKESGEILMR